VAQIVFDNEFIVGILCICFVLNYYKLVSISQFLWIGCPTQNI